MKDDLDVQATMRRGDRLRWRSRLVSIGLIALIPIGLASLPDQAEPPGKDSLVALLGGALDDQPCAMEYPLVVTMRDDVDLGEAESLAKEAESWSQVSSVVRVSSNTHTEEAREALESRDEGSNVTMPGSLNPQLRIDVHELDLIEPVADLLRASPHFKIVSTLDVATPEQQRTVCSP